MFNNEFFPTPVKVIEKMLEGVDFFNKVILEPESGKGDVIEYLYSNGAKEVLCSEINSDLAQLSIKKGGRFICSDCMDLKSEDISHIQLIIMNPPFSVADKHILHLFEVAPEGCEIISLCNWELVEERYSRYSSRSLEVSSLVSRYGWKENLGDCFNEAERKTNIEIGLIHIFKPKTGDNEFEDCFDMSEEFEHQENGIVKYDEIKEIVNRYIGAIKLFDSVEEMSNQMNSIISPISGTLNISFGAHKTNRDDTFEKVSRDVFKKQLQKSAWNTVFSKFKNLSKYLTKSVMVDINKFIEKQSHVPFTTKNIYTMILIIVGTQENRINAVFVEAFENICSFSNDNHTGGEGWKTNSDYKINKRFIIPYLTEKGYDNNMKIKYGGAEKINDINRALCYLTGTDFNSIIDIERFNCPNFEELYDWGFFRFRGYKKGTIHFEFKDIKVQELFNRKVAELKGWRLPEKTN